MNEQRDFKGIWIPKEIYLSKELNWTDKILLLEIDSLDTEEEHCFASNEYFANFLGINERRVRASISKLKDMGLIEQVYFDGRKRGLKSNLSTKLSTDNTKKTSDRTQTAGPRGRKQPVREDVCFTHNNIINNINNNNINKKTILVSDQFDIGEFIGSDIEIYREELGSVVDDVAEWIIKNKTGKRIDKEFVRRQFITFAKRQGIIP